MGKALAQESVAGSISCFFDLWSSRFLLFFGHCFMFVGYRSSDTRCLTPCDWRLFLYAGAWQEPPFRMRSRSHPCCNHLPRLSLGIYTMASRWKKDGSSPMRTRCPPTGMWGNLCDAYRSDSRGFQRNLSYQPFLALEFEPQACPPTKNACDGEALYWCGSWCFTVVYGQGLGTSIGSGETLINDF